MATEAETIADLARRAGGVPQIIKTGDGRELLVLPDGLTSTDVTDPHGLLPAPSAIKQRVTLQDAESLVAYVNRFKGDNTILLGDMAANKIVGLIDYHGPASQPENVQHIASMELPFSDEWATWKAMSGRLVGQLEFARFVEENAADVVAPSGADLLEIVRDLQAVRKVNFKKVVRTASGTERFEYSTDETATTRGGDVEVPTKFLLGIPVYFNDAPVSVPAFLRWKLNDGDLTIGLQLHRPEHVRQDRFKAIVRSVASDTDRPCMFGKLG